MVMRLALMNSRSVHWWRNGTDGSRSTLLRKPFPLQDSAPFGHFCRPYCSLGCSLILRLRRWLHTLLPNISLLLQSRNCGTKWCGIGLMESRRSGRFQGTVSLRKNKRWKSCAIKTERGNEKEKYTSAKFVEYMYFTSLFQ